MCELLKGSIPRVIVTVNKRAQTGADKNDVANSPSDDGRASTTTRKAHEQRDAHADTAIHLCSLAATARTSTLITYHAEPPRHIHTDTHLTRPSTA